MADRRLDELREVRAAAERVAAVDVDGAAGDPAGFGADQEAGEVGDVFGLADAVERLGARINYIQ